MTKLIDLLFKISIIKFIKYNFFSKQIKREKGVFIIPYKNSIFDLSKKSQIIIKGKHLHIGVNRLKGSHIETLIRMEDNAIWYVNNGAGICYGTTIEIKEGAILAMGYIFMNTGSVVICSRNIEFGNSVWIGRNNTIYDNDHHQILDENNNVKNLIAPVRIGNNVWITNHISITKGVTIGDGVVITPYTLVKKNIEKNKMAGQRSEVSIFNENVKWSPDLIK